MINYTNNLIWIFMNINVKIRNKKRLVEKWRWYTYKMSYTSAVYKTRLWQLVSNKSLDIAIYPKLLNMRII